MNGILITIVDVVLAANMITSGIHLPFETAVIMSYNSER